MRRRLFEYLVYKVFKHNPACMLPWWGHAIRWILMPLNSFMFTFFEHWADVKYDMMRDQVIIGGQKFSRRFFTMLKIPGRLEICKDELTGTIYFKNI